MRRQLSANAIGTAAAALPLAETSAAAASCVDEGKLGIDPFSAANIRNFPE